MWPRCPDQAVWTRVLCTIDSAGIGSPYVFQFRLVFICVFLVKSCKYKVSSHFICICFHPSEASIIGDSILHLHLWRCVSDAQVDKQSLEREELDPGSYSYTDRKQSCTSVFKPWSEVARADDECSPMNSC